MELKLEFKKQDCWIGLFWRKTKHINEVWICIIPMFPIHITWYDEIPGYGERE